MRTDGSAGRWIKFCAVGGIGIGVQLTTLAALTAARVNYLTATGLAVEAAVAHNFLWHERFTWKDRLEGTTLTRRWARFGRFQLGNGAMSLLANLAIMRALVGGLRLPVVAANLMTISACAVLNFVVSDRWVFWPERLGPGAEEAVGVQAG